MRSIAFLALLICTGCPGTAENAVREWASQRQAAGGAEADFDPFRFLGKPRDLPEMEPLQGEWRVEAQGDARRLLGLRGDADRVMFDGTHLYTLPDKEAGLVLYALAGGVDEEPLSASAWLVLTDGESNSLMPYCVRLTPDEDGWSMTLSFDPSPLLAVKEGDERPARALPIRAADEDVPCVMQKAAPTLTLRRPQ